MTSLLTLGGTDGTAVEMSASEQEKGKGNEGSGCHESFCLKKWLYVVCYILVVLSDQIQEE